MPARHTLCQLSYRPTGWWKRLDSNQQPPACKTGALPLSYAPVEPARGIEPPSTVYKTVALPLSYAGWRERRESNSRSVFCRHVPYHLGHVLGTTLFDCLADKRKGLSCSLRPALWSPYRQTAVTPGRRPLVAAHAAARVVVAVIRSVMAADNMLPQPMLHYKAWWEGGEPRAEI